MRIQVALLVALFASPAFGQTCGPSVPDPVPRDALRLNWTAPTTWAEGGNIPTPSQLTYTVYRMVGTTPTLLCTTVALSAGLTGLPVGQQCYALTAKTPLSVPANTESVRTATVCKTIAPPPLTPNPPGSFTITGEIVVNLTVTPNP
jgi:hypothetical protein